METGMKIVRCPKCGSMRLEGVYEESKGTGWKLFFFGIWYWLFSALRDKPRSYWVCTECGETFPME